MNYTTELHAVWDSGAGQWVDDMVRPLNSTGQQWIDDFTTNIITAYPPTDPTIAPLIKQYNQSQWANESNQIANDFVYTAPQVSALFLTGCSHKHARELLSEAEFIDDRGGQARGRACAPMVEFNQLLCFSTRPL